MFLYLYVQPISYILKALGSGWRNFLFPGVSLGCIWTLFIAFLSQWIWTFRQFCKSLKASKLLQFTLVSPCDSCFEQFRREARGNWPVLENARDFGHLLVLVRQSRSHDLHLNSDWPNWRFFSRSRACSCCLDASVLHLCSSQAWTTMTPIRFFCESLLSLSSSRLADQ